MRPTAKLTVRFLVVLTVVILIFTAFEGCQVIRSETMAVVIVGDWGKFGRHHYPRNQSDRLMLEVDFWRQSSWWGRYDKPWGGWLPRHTNYQVLRQMTGMELPEDPDLWEAWIRKNGEDIVWDDRLGRYALPKGIVQNSERKS